MPGSRAMKKARSRLGRGLRRSSKSRGARTSRLPTQGGEQSGEEICPAAVEEEHHRGGENVKGMRRERGAFALGDAQGLQGGRGFGVGEGHGAKGNETQGEGNQKSQHVEQAFVFEVSVGHGGYCIKDGRWTMDDRPCSIPWSIVHGLWSYFGTS
jgi:hypothetical protein